MSDLIIDSPRPTIAATTTIQLPPENGTPEAISLGCLPSNIGLNFQIKLTSEPFFNVKPEDSSDKPEDKNVTSESCSPNFPVDVVFTWVNGSNPELLANLTKYTSAPIEKNRIVDLGQLKAQVLIHVFVTY